MSYLSQYLHTTHAPSGYVDFNQVIVYNLVDSLDPYFCIWCSVVLVVEVT